MQLPAIHLDVAMDPAAMLTEFRTAQSRTKAEQQNLAKATQQAMERAAARHPDPQLLAARVKLAMERAQAARGDLARLSPETWTQIAGEMDAQTLKNFKLAGREAAHHGRTGTQHLVITRPEDIASASQSHPQVKTITLRGAHITDASLANLPSGLTELTLDDTTGVTPVGLTQLLARQPGLQKMVLGGAVFSDAHLAALPASLTSLRLEGTRGTTAAGLAQLGPRLPHLRNLELSGGHLRDDHLANLPRSLTHLKLEDARGSFTSDGLFRMAFRVPQLTSFSANDCNLGSQDLIPAVGFLDKLADLDLSRNMIGGLALQHIGRHQGIRRLDISNNMLYLAGDDSLQPLTGMASLSTLAIEGNGFGEAAARHASNCSALTVLHAANNEMGSAGMRWIGANPRLVEVDVSDNRVDEQGCVHLSQSQSIRDLKVEGNDLTGQGAEALAAMPLRTLRIARAWIEDAGLQALRNGSFQLWT